MPTKKLTNGLPVDVQEKLEGFGNFPWKSQLIAWLERLFEVFTPEFIAIFGSVPRAQATNQSDLDVFVVASDFPDNPLRRYDVLNRFFIPNIDARPHTPTEFKLMVENWDLTVLEMFHDHWFILDSTGFGESSYNTFLELTRQNKLVRSKFAWIVNV